MEESERTIKCAPSENIEIKDFSSELVDFPHVLEYVKTLEEKFKLQQDEICKLRKQLTNNENQCTILEKTFSNVETQTDCLELKEPLNQKWVTDDAEKSSSIVDQVTEAASSAMLETGFVYEKTTGLYYHYKSGYYYNAELGLYYDGNTGTYYYYDKDSESYKFHSQVYNESNKTVHDLPSVQEKEKEDDNENKDRVKKIKLMEREVKSTITQVEEDKCSNSENEECLNIEKVISSLSSNAENDVKIDEDIAKDYPPCMRIVVKETNLSNLKVGSLFIVTYIGGSIGREGDHSVIVPDINISKHHAKLQYNEEKKIYEIIDLGSRNGTLLNGKRLSVTKQESDPNEIAHGSILQLGSTVLLCHVHDGHETCDNCEPGLLQSDAIIDENLTSIKHQHQSELKRLKVKFGLEQNNIDTASRIPSRYQDRAQLRREHVGSSSEHYKIQQSSLNESISKDNLGFKMLSKMGWSEGKSLGKNEDGITEPVSLQPTVNKSGFGAKEDCLGNARIDSSTEKKQTIWKKTQKRFNDIIK